MCRERSCVPPCASTCTPMSCAGATDKELVAFPEICMDSQCFTAPYTEGVYQLLPKNKNR